MTAKDKVVVQTHVHAHTHKTPSPEIHMILTRLVDIPRTIIIILRRMMVVPWVKETIKDGGASQATPTRILLRALRNFHTRVNNVH